jgi:hypothetical protein
MAIDPDDPDGGLTEPGYLPDDDAPADGSAPTAPLGAAAPKPSAAHDDVATVIASEPDVATVTGARAGSGTPLPFRAPSAPSAPRLPHARSSPPPARKPPSAGLPPRPSTSGLPPRPSGSGLPPHPADDDFATADDTIVPRSGSAPTADPLPFRTPPPLQPPRRAPRPAPPTIAESSPAAPAEPAGATDHLWLEGTLKLLTVEACAALAASLARRPDETERILADGALSLPMWKANEAYWAQVLREEAAKGQTTLLHAYDTAFVTRLELERGTISVEEYTRLVVAAERGQATPALRALDLPPGSMARIERVFLRRVVENPALGDKVRKAVEDLRGS